MILDIWYIIFKIIYIYIEYIYIYWVYIYIEYIYILSIYIYIECIYVYIYILSIYMFIWYIVLIQWIWWKCPNFSAWCYAWFVMLSLHFPHWPPVSWLWACDLAIKGDETDYKTAGTMSIMNSIESWKLPNCELLLRSWVISLLSSLVIVQIPKMGLNGRILVAQFALCDKWRKPIFHSYGLSG